MAADSEHTLQSPTPERAQSMSSSSDRELSKQPESPTSQIEKRGLQTPQLESATPAPPAPKPNANDSNPPPNGGMQAWLQVLGSFMLFFNTWGILNAFGVFQTYYETGELFTESSSNISWIGAIQAYCVLVVGFFSGPIYDRGYLPHLLVVGSFGVVFGHMMLSLCHTYWQCLLAQGFCVGIGAGCLYIPAIAVLPGYFTSKIGLAIGLAASGSSTGGIIYPIVFYRLISRIGFAWSVRVLGFIALGTLIMPILCMKIRIKPQKARALMDWSAFTDFQFMLFTIGAVIGFMGLYVMFFYISFYAEQQQIANEAMSFYLVPILNAASVFGRTIPNAISDIIGPLNIITPGAFIVGIAIFCMIAVHSLAPIIVIAILFGFFSGVFIALPPVCFVALTKDKSKIGTRMGMGFGMIGFGVLAGGPGGGSILGTDSTVLNWTGLWTYGGVSGCCAGLVFLAVRVIRSGWKVNVKV